MPGSQSHLDNPSFDLVLAAQALGRSRDQGAVFHRDDAVGDAGDLCVVCDQNQRGPRLPPDVQQGLQHGLADVKLAGGSAAQHVDGKHGTLQTLGSAGRIRIP